MSPRRIGALILITAGVLVQLHFTNGRNQWQDFIGLSLVIVGTTFIFFGTSSGDSAG